MRFRLPADELEYAVLTQLWELGVASVRELHRRLGEPEGLVYTTTAKVVDRLRSKGLVLRQRQRKGQQWKHYSTDFRGLAHHVSPARLCQGSLTIAE